MTYSDTNSSSDEIDTLAAACIENVPMTVSDNSELEENGTEVIPENVIQGNGSDHINDGDDYGHDNDDDDDNADYWGDIVSDIPLHHQMNWKARQILLKRTWQHGSTTMELNIMQLTVFLKYCKDLDIPICQAQLGHCSIP